MIIQQYTCAECGVFELYEPVNEDESPRSCPICGGDSDYRMSAPMGRVKAGEVIRGASDERPPHALDTRALAEGMPLHEWRAKQTKIGIEQLRKRNRGRVS